MTETSLDYNKIAEQEAKRAGYDTTMKEVVVDTDRSNVAVFRLVQMMGEDSVESDKLRGADFVAVYYHPVQNQGHFVLGGEFYVFIDRTTGNVIYSVKLK